VEMHILWALHGPEQFSGPTGAVNTFLHDAGADKTR